MSISIFLAKLQENSFDKSKNSTSIPTIDMIRAYGS